MAKKITKAAKVAAKKITIGGEALKMMGKGWDNDKVLAALKAKFPKSKVSMNSVTWYRSDFRRKGVKLLTNHELHAAQ